ncbi:hypothetical protein [Sphingobium sp. C100]|uniref:hypothetical protein n=1 Tax=Sphingobium sp. C100 TaxID=1207055 RepID=UPI00126880EE|nr:hypothetical protein [Sphingobium sp. C100]
MRIATATILSSLLFASSAHAVAPTATEDNDETTTGQFVCRYIVHPHSSRMAGSKTCGTPEQWDAYVAKQRAKDKLRLILRATNGNR